MVDEVEVNDDPEAYLAQYLDEIKEIEVIAIPAEDFVNDLHLSTEEYLLGALPQIEQLSAAFTEEEQVEQWADLNDLFGGIEWVTLMLAVVDNSTARPTKWDQVDFEYQVVTQLYCSETPVFADIDERTYK